MITTNGTVKEEVYGKKPAILGVDTCERLGLLKRVCIVDGDTAEVDYSELFNEYNDLFQGFECLEGKYSINVDENVAPIVHPARKVPFAQEGKLKDDLERMEKLEVIEKVDEPTDWVNSLVLVEKKNGKLRICIDPRDLNRAIRREHFKLPTRDEIMAQLSNAKYFSKLDAF